MKAVPQLFRVFIYLFLFLFPSPCVGVVCMHLHKHFLTCALAHGDPRFMWKSSSPQSLFYLIRRDMVYPSNPELAKMATVASQCAQDPPPSEAGLSGGPKHTISAYEFTWAVGSKLWQELFPPGCLPSPSRVICSFPRSQWSLLFLTAEASSLLHLPSYSSDAPKTPSAKKPWFDSNFLGPFSSFSCLLLSKLWQK